MPLTRLALAPAAALALGLLATHAVAWGLAFGAEDQVRLLVQVVGVRLDAARPGGDSRPRPPAPAPAPALQQALRHQGCDQRQLGQSARAPHRPVLRFSAAGQSPLRRATQKVAPSGP